MASREITLREHFKELRKRLIISVLSILIGSAICFSFWQDIVLLLEQPARFYGVYSEQGLIFTEVTELLSTSFKVSILGGFVLAFPIVAYLQERSLGGKGHRAFVDSKFRHTGTDTCIGCFN